MAVYVDDELIDWRGRQWCHMVADSLPELHEFALQLGLRQSWFQSKSKYPHYDVTVGMRNKAIRLGAIMGDRTQIISCAKNLQAQLYSNTQHTIKI